MSTKNKIIVILMAGIVAMAIGVPMAMGDEATQSATVSQAVGTVQLKEPTTPWGDVGAWSFPASVPGTTDIEVTGQTISTPTAVVAANNTGTADMNVYMYASDWTNASGTILIDNETMAHAVAGVVPATFTELTTTAPGAPQITGLAPNANQSLYFKLSIPSNAVVGAYTSQFTVESSSA